MTDLEILMINYEYPPIGGGTAKACEKVINNINDEDVKIHLITSSPSNYYRETHENLVIDRIDVHKEEDHVWKFTEVFWFIFKASYHARKLTSKKDFDIVHAWTGFPCGTVARFLGHPYIVSLRGGDVPEFDERFTLYYPFLKPLIKNIWSNAKNVIPNSTGLKELAKQTMDREMMVIPNGVNTEKFYPKDEYNKCSNDTLKLVTVCRLSEMKRTSDVIRAVKDLDDVQLDIIGTGDLENRLKELTSELGLESKVRFLGYVENEDLPDFLNRADIFLLPSLNEGMSNAILEAMSSGLPIVMTDVGGSDELIDGNGFIVEKKNPGDINKALKKYSEDPKLIEKHGRKSREIAESKDWKNISEQFLNAYMRFNT